MSQSALRICAGRAAIRLRPPHEPAPASTPVGEPEIADTHEPLDDRLIAAFDVSMATPLRELEVELVCVTGVRDAMTREGLVILHGRHGCGRTPRGTQR